MILKTLLLVSFLTCTTHAADDTQEIFIEQSPMVNTTSLNPNGDAEHLVDVEIKPLPSSSLKRQVLRGLGALTLAGGVANGMIPIFLEDAAEAGLTLRSSFLGVAIYTGISFGVEALVSRLSPISDTNVSKRFVGVCLMDAMIPVLLLFHVQEQHHKDAHHQGWDDYYTFFAVLSPFLAVNQFLNTYGFAQEFLKSDDQKAIAGAIDRLKENEVTELLDEIEQTGAPTLTLPYKPPQIKSNPKNIVAGLIALASLPASYMFFEGVLEEEIGLPSTFAYPLAVIPSIGYGVLGYTHLSGFQRQDLWFLLQGAFKALPLSLLVWVKSEPLPVGLREVSTIGFVLTELSAKTRELKEMVFKGLNKIPWFKNRLWVKRERLKERLV